MYDDRKHREVLTAARPVKLYPMGTGIVAVGQGGGYWIVPDDNYLALLIAWEIAGPNIVARPIDQNELGAMCGMLATLNPAGDGHPAARVEAVLSISPEDAKRIAAEIDAPTREQIANEIAERLRE